MRVYAHRGASAEAPENTLAGFARAVEVGADGIELDVHVSADGVPVVIHDQEVGRTTSGHGLVRELTVEDLRRLDAGQGQPVPTLGDVIELVGGRLLLDVEVKAAGAGAATLATLAALDYDQWVLSSFDWEILRDVRRMAPRAELWPLSFTASDEAVELAHEIDAPLLALHANVVDADIVKYLQAQGLSFMAWTVNDPHRAHALEALGAAAICSDDPRRLRSVLPR